MTSKISVRRGGRADASALADFAARTFEETFGPENSPEDMAAHLASTYGVAQQTRELSDPDYITLLIDGGYGLAAYAQLRRNSPPACVKGVAPIEVYRFYVDHPFQGQGLAHTLMVAVRDAAPELDAQTLWLSVWEKNGR